MQSGKNKSMKTAISIDDSLMEQADNAARELGLSRSGLIAEALRGYLQHRHQARVSELLNEAYASVPSSAEKTLVGKLKTKLPVLDRW